MALYLYWYLNVNIDVKEYGSWEKLGGFILYLVYNILNIAWNLIKRKCFVSFLATDNPSSEFKINPRLSPLETDNLIYYHYIDIGTCNKRNLNFFRNVSTYKL